MENELNVFIGMMASAPNLFFMGQAQGVVRPDARMAELTGVVRVFEVPDQEQKKVGYQFHPDPYFTADSVANIRLDDFVIWKVVSNQDDKIVKEYRNFLMQFRFQRAGLVPGQMNPDRSKQFIKGV